MSKKYYTVRLSILEHEPGSEGINEIDFHPQLFGRQDDFSLPFVLLRCGVNDEDMKVFKKKFQVNK